MGSALASGDGFGAIPAGLRNADTALAIPVRVERAHVEMLAHVTHAERQFAELAGLQDASSGKAGQRTAAHLPRQLGRWNSAQVDYGSRCSHDDHSFSV